MKGGGRVMRKLAVLGAVLITVLAAAVVINYAIYEEPTTLNPWNYYGPNATVWNQYVLAGKWGSLYTYSDKRFDFIPSLAADMPEKSKEGDLWVYTIKLRKGIVWSDGTPFTADDVVFSINTAVKLIKDKGLGGNWAAMYDPDFVDHAEKVDDYTVKIYFKKLGLAKVEFGALMGVILQKKYWEPIVEEALKKDNTLQYLYDEKWSKDEPGLGAFLMKKWEKGAFVENEAIPDYYDKGFEEVLYKNGAVELKDPMGWTWTGYGKPEGDVELKIVTGPYVDGIIYKIYKERAVAITALLNGDVSYIFNPLGLQKGELDQLKGAPGVKIVTNASNGFRYLAFNMRRYPMNIKEFREAIAVLIDRNFLCGRILQGQAIPLNTVVPPGNVFWHNPNVKTAAERLIGKPEKEITMGDRYRKAIELLKKAGFRWIVPPKVVGDKVVRAGKGLIGPDGKPVKEIELLAPGAGYDPMRATTALFIQDWANAIGIPVKAHLVDFNYIVSKVWEENFNYDMYILGWGLSIYPDYIVDFFSSKRAGPGDFNTPGYMNPEFDEVGDEFLAATDLEKAKELAYKLQEMLAEDLPYVVLFTAPIYEAYRADQIQFPYTEVLDGLQSFSAFPTTVRPVSK